MKTIDITGQSFGDWLVLGFSEKENGCYYWRCKCSCGKTIDVAKQNLLRGLSKSCGCKRDLAAKTRETTHGKSKTRTYRIWASMITRCTNPNDVSYIQYGKRGIRVCKKWRNFSGFLDDMGEISDGYSLDRIDPNGDYIQSNCRFVPRERQSRNKRNTVWTCINGERKPVIDWCEEFGIPYKRVISRMKKWNCSFDEAIKHPVRRFLNRPEFSINKLGQRIK